MNDETTPDCPRIEAISALLDGMLPTQRAADMKRHAANCPLCGAQLRDFEALRTRLHVLRDTHSDVDIAALIGPRLGPRVPARSRKPVRPWDELWQLVPGGLAAAGALGAGAYLGLLLVTGSGAALQPTAMTVFDAVPPGALCAGLPACSPRRR